MTNNPFETLDARLRNIEALLLDIKHPTTPERLEIPVDKPLTIKEAAAFLSLAVPTIYGLVSRGELPYQKRGKRLYFLTSELTDWVKQGRRKTNAELKAEADEVFTTRNSR